MFTFATRPHLMISFETFIANFGTCREIRSLDSQVKLYSIHTAIPEVLPKEYEHLPLEDITYQGAYIRTMTMLFLEGLVKNCIQSLLQSKQNN